MRSSGPRVSSVGETELIRLIRKWLGALSPAAPAGIGDDCAVLGVSRKKQLLTIDPVIRGIHFDTRTPARLAGAKLLKRNLSDIAAMGGRPRAAVVSVALDGRLPLRWLREFYAGLAAVGRNHGVAIVGGDVARLPGSFVATLALVGEANGRVLTRSGSRVGDWIYVTGSLGRSLKTGHHLRFEPRLAEGAWLAGRREVRALIDVSDGLAKDLPSLAPRGAEPAILASLLPRRSGSSLREALGDGEDYELLFCVAARARHGSLLRDWQRAFPKTRLTCIGRFVRAGSVPQDAVPLSTYHGYEHLR